MTTPSFTHLTARTCYSLRDGVIRPHELAQATARMGMAAVGVTDRAGLYGGVRFAQACRAAGVRPIYGATLALAPDGGRPGWEITRGPGVGTLMGPGVGRGLGGPYDNGRSGIGRSGVPSGIGFSGIGFSGIGSGRGQAKGPGSGQAWLADDAAQVALIAADEGGFATLNRVITDHHLDNPRGAPHLRWDHVVHRLGSADRCGGGAGVFVLLGDNSPVGRLLAQGRHDAARQETRRWLHLLGPKRLLIGVTHHQAPGDDARARAAFALADDLGLRAVADQQARYLRQQDARVADVMDAVRQQVPLAQHHSSRRNAQGFLTSPAQMAAVFRERPDALRNTMWVAEQCHVDIGLGRLRVPDFVTGPSGTNDPAWALAELRQRCEHGLVERFGTVAGRSQGGFEDVGRSGHLPSTQQLDDLLDRELAMIKRMGLAGYFLTVAEIMDRIRSKGILAACRGSAASSLVTYALRISDVNPITHDLAFERFMNPYRDELPDIDIDVESARREDIYRDLLETYGEDRVACVAMVETFKARMAIREVGKAIGMPAGEIDYIAKAFPHVRAGDVRPALDHLPELQGLNLDSGHLRLLFDVVDRLDGFPRHIALHPCGIILADSTLRDLVPMERSAPRGPSDDGFAMAQYDKDDVEALGLCKLDVLAIRMLSSMAHCIEEVRETRGADIDFDHVGWADGDTYELIQSTRTLGMFQIESPGQRELVGKFQPEHLDDLVVDISLFRPGPVKGDMVKPFLKRRHGEEASGVPHPILERALGETFGVIVYHEQVMRAISAVTGCDLAEADLARRRLGDPTQLEQLERWIKRGAAERGVPPEVAEWLWVSLAQFASFGFCKAHAAAFSVPTYRSAWLKAHFLPEFVAGLLTNDPGMYPRRLIMDDARQFGVAILPLDVNLSASDYRVEIIREDEAYALLGVDQDRLAEADVARGRGGPVRERGTSPHGGEPDLAAGNLTLQRGISPRPQDVWTPRGWSRDDDGALLPPAGFDKGKAEPGWRYAIRMGLQDVERIDESMINSLLLGRPFTSVGDLRLRARLSKPVVESLTHAGALDVIGGIGSATVRVPSVPSSGPRGHAPGSGTEQTTKTRRDLLLEVGERWSGLKRHAVSRPDQPQQLGLLEPEEALGLPAYRPSDIVRAELEVTGLDSSRHVISFYDTLLDQLGVTRAVDLLECRENQMVRIAGVKVATQTPPVKSGQRVIFLSLDDSTGVGDATFFESVHEECAWTVFHTWLLVVEGRVHRSGRRGVSLTASSVWDLRRLMRAWQQGWLPEAMGESGRHVRAGQPVRGQAGAVERSHDGAPSEGIRGAPGRSGIRFAHRPGEHLVMAKAKPFGGAGPAAGVGSAGPNAGRQGLAASATPDETSTTGSDSPLIGGLRPGDLAARADATARANTVGSPSRIGPNGTTWADPAGRHPGVDSQDVKRLSPNDPRRRDDPRAAGERHEEEPPRKLWHSSPGSAGH